MRRTSPSARPSLTESLAFEGSDELHGPDRHHRCRCLPGQASRFRGPVTGRPLGRIVGGVNSHTTETHSLQPQEGRSEDER
jgi:hypothetical protein